MSPSFEWDPAKDAQNQRKHGVAFADAQLAFLDPARVIAKDLSHSKGEPRFYCFGEVGGGVLTVRFTYRAEVIRIFGAGYWRRGKRCNGRPPFLDRRVVIEVGSGSGPLGSRRHQMCQSGSVCHPLKGQGGLS